jgi:hypothetical protein
MSCLQTKPPTDLFCKLITPQKKELAEIINIPTLTIRFQEAVKQGYLNKTLDEIILQSKVEFNYEDDENEK